MTVSSFFTSSLPIIRQENIHTATAWTLDSVESKSWTARSQNPVQQGVKNLQSKSGSVGISYPEQHGESKSWTAGAKILDSDESKSLTAESQNPGSGDSLSWTVSGQNPRVNILDSRESKS